MTAAHAMTPNSRATSGGLTTQKLSLWYGSFQALKSVTLTFQH